MHMATEAMAGINKLWRSRDMHMSVKTTEMLRTPVVSVLHYATKTWTIKKMEQDRLLAF